MDELYKRIEDLCDEKGINITKMCQESGVPRATLSDYKSGRRKSIGVKSLSKIAEYFGVSVGYLLGEEQKEKSPNITVRTESGSIMALDQDTLEYIDSLRARPEMRMLFSVSKKATKEDIIKAVKIIEALRDESEND